MISSVRQKNYNDEQNGDSEGNSSLERPSNVVPAMVKVPCCQISMQQVEYQHLSKLPIPALQISLTSQSS